jgi:hypothetical protein
VRCILEIIVVTGEESNQPSDASRAGTVMPLQSIKLSLTRNSARSGEHPIVDEECLFAVASDVGGYEHNEMKNE